MKTQLKLTCGFIAGVFFIFSFSTVPLKAASTLPVLICYPGGPVTEKDAEKAMSAMMKLIETTGSFAPGTFTASFSGTTQDCQKQWAQKKPAFAFESMGLFLAQEKTYKLTPLVQPKINGLTTEVYRVLIKKGTAQTLQDLKGKTLGGSLLDQNEFLQKIVFKGQINPAEFFVLKPSSRPLDALRRLSRGQLDAVLVNDQQFRALAGLPLAESLAPIFTADPFPQIGLVANLATTSPEQRAKLSSALAELCRTPDGKKLCELFGIEAFVPANIQTFEEVLRLWNKPASVK